MKTPGGARLNEAFGRCNNKMQIKQEVKQQLYIKKVISTAPRGKYKNSDTVFFCHWSAVTGVSLSPSKEQETGPVTLLNQVILKQDHSWEDLF